MSVALEVEETRLLLQEVPQAYNTQINDVLLSALGLALSEVTGKSTVVVDLEGQGREALFDGADVSRTVGWFTTMFPVRLELRGTAGPGEVLKSVKEQLRSVPNRGIGYGLLRYLGGDEKIARPLRALMRPDVVFNYLGQFDQTLHAAGEFALVEESPESVRSNRAHRSHLLHIVGQVVGNRLRLDWVYSKNVHRHGTIERLAQRFMQSLRDLVQHCTSPNAGGLTPSDFAEAGLDQRQLDQLISELGE